MSIHRDCTCEHGPCYKNEGYKKGVFLLRNLPYKYIALQVHVLHQNSVYCFFFSFFNIHHGGHVITFAKGHSFSACLVKGIFKNEFGLSEIYNMT